jgi:predicted nucleotidyltransferase
MVRVDRDEVTRRITAACSGCRDVAAAYLFGSALGDMRPDSDIDVGVVLRPIGDLDDRAAFQRELRVESELAYRLGWSPWPAAWAGRVRSHRSGGGAIRSGRFAARPHDSREPVVQWGRVRQHEEAECHDIPA